MSFDDLIDEVISVTQDDYEKCIRFMVSCCSLLRANVIPEIAVQGLDVAGRYWNGNSTNSVELDKARIGCWDYLRERSASMNVEERKYCAVRAVICVLYSQPPFDDNGELLDWFFRMLLCANDDEVSLLNDLALLIDESSGSV